MKQFSLTEIASFVEDALSLLPADTYWVRAEIASLSSRGGHGYFELVEKGETGMPAAKMRATCWSNIYPMLQAYFEQETGQRLQVGMQVLLEVSIQFHALYGLSLNIQNIDPRFTVGDLARQRQLTIQRLQEEGVMDMQQQLSLPTLVRRLAVISASEAAGYGDFVAQLRESGFAIETTLFPAIMQGDKAEASILSAMKQVMRESDEWDAVIIIRGGGATTDLGCFDSYTLAAACAQFPLPVLTGIGHTRDVSIVDMVAHQALKTPTAVAAFLIQRFVSEQEHVRMLRQRLQQTADKQILIRKHTIEMLRQRLAMCSPERIYRMGYSLLMVDGQVVHSAASLQPGQHIQTHLMDGVVHSVVE